jgi:hypothetical protein
MSHGLSALCFAGALALFFRAQNAARLALDPLNPNPPAPAPRPHLAPPRRALALALAAGLLLGWLAAARPVSSLALAASLALALALDRTLPVAARVRLAAALVIAALPGLALLAAHQRAATGAWASSSQMLYYAASDGPPGCFRYGFGEGIGCLGEHGDFVRANLPRGYGPLEAAATTLRRLKMHLVDVANAEPLALLIPLGAILGRRAPRVRLLALTIALQIAAYAPFYFDGNYPGGGARLFADVLPLEHVLVALAAVMIARRFAPSAARAHRLAAAVVALALAGFALRAGFDHADLRDREGGVPMFDPAHLTAAGVTRGLVFVDTDHGFNLAFDPSATRDSPLQIARFRADSTDLMTWQARGRPDAFRYRYRFPAAPLGPELATIAVEPLHFNLAAPVVIEGESLWPARSQDRAWALFEHAAGTCASSGRWLAVHTRIGDEGSILLDLPAQALRGRSISPRIGVAASRADPRAPRDPSPPSIPARQDSAALLLGELILLIDGAEARRWPIGMPAPSFDPAPSCVTLSPEPISEAARDVKIRIIRSSNSPPNPAFSEPNPSLKAPTLALDSVLLGERENR